MQKETHAKRDACKKRRMQKETHAKSQQRDTQAATYKATACSREKQLRARHYRGLLLYGKVAPIKLTARASRCEQKGPELTNHHTPWQ